MPLHLYQLESWTRFCPNSLVICSQQQHPLEHSQLAAAAAMWPKQQTGGQKGLSD